MKTLLTPLERRELLIRMRPYLIQRARTDERVMRNYEKKTRALSEPGSKHLTPSEPGQGSEEARASSGDARNSPAPGRLIQGSGSLSASGAWW